jgi:2-alkenal reductase
MRSNRWWLLLPGGVVVLFALLLTAIVGGAIGSGVTAYYLMARQPTATARPAPLARPAAATPAPAPPGSVSSSDPRLSTVQLVQKLAPSVVTILSSQTQGAGRQLVRGAGTGVIVDKSGLVVTNQHVVGDEDGVQVIFSDGRRSVGRVLGRDKDQDLAVVQIDGEMPGVADLGDSSLVAVGEPVLAIGSALGDYQGTVTFGIVSGLDRKLPSGNPGVSGLIQTDAALNHGNSGGPLFNYAGQVIGINTAVVRTSGNPGESAEGLGFAIPINRVRTFVNQLVGRGTAPRPDLGVSYTGDAGGATVREVLANSAAARGGLREGDVITAVNGDKVSDTADLKDVLGRYQPGDEIELTFTRAGKEQKVRVTLGARQ